MSRFGEGSKSSTSARHAASASFSPRYPACVARRLHSYGRSAKKWTVDDFPDTYKAFQSSGFRLRALLRSMALSDSFYAVAPPANPATTTLKEVALK